MKRTPLAALLLAAVTTTGLMAAPFQNGSFETGTLVNTATWDTLPAGSTAITGWTVVGDGIDYIGAGWVAANGSRAIDTLSCGVSGGVSQTFDTVPGSTYWVSFALAGNPDGGVKTVTATAGPTTANFTFNTAGATATAMNWSTRSFVFTANSTATTLTLRGGILGGGSSCAGAAIDNVAVNLLSANVPVPVEGGGIAAVLLAIAGAAALRRRKRA
jgi:choice-of-anchor C domain-containing protein